MLFKEFNIWPYGAKIWVQVGSKMAKKVVFIPATLLPTQFVFFFYWDSLQARLNSHLQGMELQEKETQKD